MAFWPPSVIQGAPSGPTMTPWGAALLAAVPDGAVGRGGDVVGESAGWKLIEARLGGEGGRGEHAGERDHGRRERMSDGFHQGPPKGTSHFAGAYHT
jgi:hypothetical protein